MKLPSRAEMVLLISTSTPWAFCRSNPILWAVYYPLHPQNTTEIPHRVEKPAWGVPARRTKQVWKQPDSPSIKINLSNTSLQDRVDMSCPPSSAEQQLCYISGKNARLVLEMVLRKFYIKTLRTVNIRKSKLFQMLSSYRTMFLLWFIRYSSYSL